MAENRLKELRKKKRISQVKVQLLTGIDQSDYSKIETGKRTPTVEQAKRLSALFDTSIDYIYGMTDNPTPYPKTAVSGSTVIHDISTTNEFNDKNN